MTIDLSIPREIYILGIGGAGMSALASVLAAMGHSVSGSDLKASQGTERLSAAGIPVFIGHRSENLSHLARSSDTLIARSSAVKDSNLEVQAAKASGISVCSRAEILAAVCRLRQSFAIAGTHGKTTTTSMLGLILREAGRDPSFLVGGDVNEIGSGALWGQGPWLVVEADESDGTFLQLAPQAAAVTSTEADHLDLYKSETGFQEAFGRFLDELGARNGYRLVCVDEEWGRDYASRHPAVHTYGCSEEADLCLTELSTKRSSVEFLLSRRDAAEVRMKLPLPGVHNALNAACAAGCALHIGVGLEESSRILARFGGVARRYEFRGCAAGVTFIDDYAHLPGGVKRVLHAARSGGWRRVVCVFQPHRFSRTSHLHREFSTAFADADVVVLTDVYAAGEDPLPGVSGKLILDALLEAEPQKRAGWFPHREELSAYLLSELKEGDVCLILNAGDLTTIADELMNRLEARG